MSWNTTPPEVVHRVLGFVSVPQLARLGQTSRAHYAIVKQEVRNRVTSTLSRNHLPYDFLGFMRDHKLVVSGSIALDILQPHTVVPKDFDLFVPLGHLAVVQEYLERATDYVQRLGDEHDDEPESYVSDNGIKDVLFYTHKDHGTVINVIEAQFPVANAAVFNFHTTFVMNYLTHNSLVSGYPMMTESSVGLLNFFEDSLPRRIVQCLIKYALRGYKVLDRAYDWKQDHHTCQQYGYCAQARRSIMDEYTMRFCFEDGVGVRADVVSEDVCWKLNCSLGLIS
ncbi:hypothetical protein MD484_g7079, partial [Candolleomyces efflorescens]